jgi:hypothetical protein
MMLLLKNMIYKLGSQDTIHTESLLVVPTVLISNQEILI